MILQRYLNDTSSDSTYLNFSVMFQAKLRQNLVGKFTFLLSALKL